MVLLNRFGQDLQGVFTVNETATIGMLLALQDMNKAGKLKFLGFDASPILITAMRAGQLDGIAVQNPMRMGYLGVKTIVDHLRGKQVERRVDTGVILVTPANLDGKMHSLDVKVAGAGMTVRARKNYLARAVR